MDRGRPNRRRLPPGGLGPGRGAGPAGKAVSSQSDDDQQEEQIPGAARRNGDPLATPERAVFRRDRSLGLHWEPPADTLQAPGQLHPLQIGKDDLTAEKVIPAGAELGGPPAGWGALRRRELVAAGRGETAALVPESPGAIQGAVVNGSWPGGNSGR